MKMNPIPMFFKVFLVPISSKKLGIPLAFLTHIGGALPNKAFLRNRHGNWRVTISRDKDQFSFEEGWVQFVKDNQIKNNEFLVFRYDGGNIFYVTLYGHNGCDRDIFSQDCFVKKENEDESDEENKEESNDCTRENENSEETNDFNLNDGDYEEESEEKYPEVEHLMKRKRKTRSAKKVEKAKNVKKAENVKSEEGFEDGDDNDDDDDVFKYGLIPRPESPYFVAKLRAKRTNELLIPFDVIKDHNLKLPKEMIIEDEKEREWNAKVKIWTDGRTLLTKGYGAFIKWNHFGKQDRCICEFLNGKGETGIYLKMTILRAGSWLPKGHI